MYLRQPEIARLVVDSIHTGVDLGHYELGAYVVMANHVHLLIRPAVAPDRLLKSLKGTTARYANRLLGSTGEPFWQKESYDHWVRNQSEFEKTRAYIEANPVKAGLVRSPEDFPWSSASVETSPDHRHHQWLTLSPDKACPMCCDRPARISACAT
jgi:type I restriction enzyme R subunit/putative DNA methylase